MLDQAERLRQLTNAQTGKDPFPFIETDIFAAKEKKASRVIAITSGKGGAGKTNLAVNMALALANMGQKVLIIDADLGMANIEILLGASSKYSLLNLIEDGLTIDDIVVNGPYGIKYISGGSGVYQLANLSEEQLQKIIRHIGACDSWADFILVDTGAGISRNVINFLVAADEVIIVTTPEPTAIADAYAVMKVYAANRGNAPVKLVINRVIDYGEGEVVAEKLTQVASKFLKLRTTSLGNIYEDRNLIKSVKSQKPVLLLHPSTISVRCIENIARRLLKLQGTSQPGGIKGFFAKLTQMFR
ncbi:MAG: MinD/ParA family protein [Sporomusaceae bacterium]|jgi:flagellar biosynthesis protein FlhG|nr:MinD/ParA family protein [Sporomusaceae bacterium]